MFFYIHKWARTLWYNSWAILAALIVLLALFFTVIRVLLPYAVDYRLDIQSKASELLQKKVVIEELQTDWKWFRPRLKFMDAKVYSSTDDEIMVAEEVLFGINIFSSLLQRRFVVDDITISGTNLSLARNGAGELYLQGISLAAKTNDTEPLSLVIPPVILGRTIKLVNSTVRVDDRILDINYQFEEVSFAVRFANKTHNVYVDINLPAALGKHLELGFELKGDLSQVKNLKGKLFARGESVDVAAILDKIGYDHPLQKGKLDFDLWSEIYSAEQISIYGSLQWNEISVLLPSSKAINNSTKAWSLDSFKTDVLLSLSDTVLELKLGDISFGSDLVKWPATSLMLRAEKKGERFFDKGEVAIDYVRLQDIMPLLSFMPAANQNIYDLGLQKFSGKITNLFASWDDFSSMQDIAMRLKFDNLGWVGKNFIPSVSGLKGEVNFKNNKMDIVFDTTTGSYKQPKLFRDRLYIGELKGLVQVDMTSEQDIKIAARELLIGTPHIQTQQWFDLILSPNESPYIDLYATYQNGAVSAASQYMPYSVMPEAALKWLDDAFIDGVVKSGDLEIYGRLNKFPFLDGSGLFRVEFEAVDSVINYFSNWPALENINANVKFLGNSLHATVHQATVYDLNVYAEEVRIDNLRNTVVQAKANVYGDIKNSIKYIRNTSLSNIFSPVIYQLSGSGSQASHLILDLPVKKNLEKRFDIKSDVYNAALNFSKWGIIASDITTQFRYSNNAVKSEKFNATINKHPAQILIETNNSANTPIANINIEGNMTLTDLLGQRANGWAHYFPGQSTYSANIALALVKTEEKYPKLSMHSDLLGMAMRLPPPFSKHRDLVKNFDLEMLVNKGSTFSVKVEYDNWLKGAMLLNTSNDLMQLERANFYANHGEPITPSQPGVFVRGSIPELNIDMWQNLQTEKSGKQFSFLDKVKYIETSVGQFTYLDRMIENIGLQVTPEQHNWKIVIDSELITGNVLIPKSGFTKRGLAINLQYLDFDKVNAGFGGGSAVPQSVPPFQLQAEKMKINEWDLQDLSLLVEPIAQGLKIHSLRIADPDIGLSGSGEWLMPAPEQHSTRLNLVFNSGNVGQGISKFGYKKIIQDGYGTAKFNIYWPASPANFSLGLLEGDAYIDFKEGQVLDIEPGGGRLFGLLSVQTIPRRLALDFKDIFAKGLRFDKMKGGFDFRESNAYTEDYYIDGPVGRIDIQGRTGLVAKDYDQEVLFRPDLSSSLPIVGTLLGGTGAGVALIVADRIARVFGKQTDDLVRFRYSLKGSWEQPAMERMANKAAAAADDTQANKVN